MSRQIVKYIPKRAQSAINSRSQSRNRSQTKNTPVNVLRRYPVRRRFQQRQAVNNKQNKQVINTFNTYDESITIKKRQAIMQVSANNDGTYRLTSTIDAGITALNPGNSSMGWISQVSSAYTKYAVTHFQLEYIPSSSTTSVGNVAVYIDYEGNDDVPDDIQQFYDQKDNVTSPVYKAFSKNYAIKDLMSTVAEKQVSAEPGFDILYDMGILYVATQGFTRDGGVASLVGTLYMTYHIKLMIPQHNNNIGMLQAVSYKFAGPEDGHWTSTRTGHLAFNTQENDLHGLPQYYKAHTRCTLNIYAHVGFNTAGSPVQYRPLLQKNQVEVEPIQSDYNRLDDTYSGIQYWQIECKAGDSFEFNFNHNSELYNFTAIKIFSANIDGQIRSEVFDNKKKHTQQIVQKLERLNNFAQPEQLVLKRQNAERQITPEMTFKNKQIEMYTDDDDTQSTKNQVVNKAMNRQK